MLSRDDRYHDFMQKISSKAVEGEDGTNITPMPLNTIIMGCKYDNL